MSPTDDESPKSPSLNIRAIRHELGLSQTEFASLLAVSPRTIQSCEQGWRTPSPILEKSVLLLLMADRNGASFARQACWKATDCPSEVCESCIAFLTSQGHLCWFLTGTLCHGRRLGSWREKLSICIDCRFFKVLLKEGPPEKVARPHPFLE